MKYPTRSILALFLTGLLIGAANAETRLFQSLPNDKANSVRFVSDAPTEKIVGKTNRISGTLELDADDVSATKVGVFEVELASLRTGIGMRDRHMHANHMETDRYPMATFRLIRILSTDKPALPPGDQPAAASGGSALRIKAEWTLKLADHKIPRPELLFLKLVEEQQMSVDFTMVEKP